MEKNLGDKTLFATEKMWVMHSSKTLSRKFNLHGGL
jgi:hypothetical protein